MKKVVIALSLLFGLLLSIFIAAAIYSFTTVNPATQQINKKLAEHFSKIVYIPQGIAGPTQDFDQTTYLWEMETPQSEVVGIKLWHNTDFTSKQGTITLTLEKEEKGDPSIFNKVLPAVIADKKALKSALKPEAADLTVSDQDAYKKIELSVKESSNQTTKITWEFDKDKLPDDIKKEYRKLEQIPQPILSFLYDLPHFIVDLFSGQ